jgi:hypothetical protein
MWKDFYEPYIDENELRGFCRPLTGEGFGTTLFDLYDTIQLAIAHGWKPLGTIHDDFDNWNSSYLLDANQIVTHDDAIRCAGHKQTWRRHREIDAHDPKPTLAHLDGASGIMAGRRSIANWCRTRCWRTRVSAQNERIRDTRLGGDPH